MSTITSRQKSLDGIIVSVMQSIDKSRFGVREKIFFFKELAYLLWGGVSIIQALAVIADSSEDYALKDIAATMKNYISAGKSLSYAMNRLPDYFDESDYNIIKIGEKSWDLPLVLKALSEEYSYLTDVKNKYVSALTYPLVLVVISVAAVLSLFLLVLPNIFAIADQFNATQLPWTTTVLRDISLFLQDQRQVLLWVVWAAVVVWLIYFSTEQGRKNLFTWITMLPLFGVMTKYYYMIKRCRYMRLMFRAGLSYVQTFQLLRNVLAIPAYQDMVERTIAWLQKWDPIYKNLLEERQLIPANVAVLIKVWEETAQLPEAIQNILDMYDTELDMLISRLAKIIEPIMLVFVWGIVVMIALWVFGLILQIMEGVGV